MMKKESNSIVKNSISLVVLVCIGKVLGFVKQSVIAWAYGANSATDIFFAADGYTSTIAQILSLSIAPTVLTSYLLIKNDEREKDANRLLNKSLRFFSIISLVLMLLSVVFSTQIASMIGISYMEEQKKVLSSFVYELSVVIIFASIAGVLQGYLNANYRYLPGRLASLFYSVFSIIAIILFKDTYGIRALIIGFLAGYFLHTVYMIFCSRKVIRFTYSRPFFDSDFTDMLRKFLPLLISMSIVDFGHLIDKIVASSLTEGSVSVLNYGQVISSDLVNAVVITTVGTVLLTSFTDAITKGENKENVVREIRNIIGIMSLIVVLLTVLYFVEGSDLISVVLQRGNFDEESTFRVSDVAFYYSIGFLFMVYREVLIKAHYAYQDMKSPVVNSIVGVLLNLVLSIILSKKMGVSGIALATSISLIVVSVLSVVTLKKHVGQYAFDKTLISGVAKIILMGVLSTIIGYTIWKHSGNLSNLVRLIFVSGIIIVVYGTIGLLLREKNMRVLLYRINDKIQK